VLLQCAAMIELAGAEAPAVDARGGELGRVASAGGDETRCGAQNDLSSAPTFAVLGSDMFFSSVKRFGFEG
jgi:hypothetical protein